MDSLQSFRELELTRALEDAQADLRWARRWVDFALGVAAGMGLGAVLLALTV